MTIEVPAILRSGAAFTFIFLFLLLGAMLNEEGVETMRIARIWADAEGASHYADMEVDWESSGPLGKMAAPLPVSSMILRENEAGYDYDWHVAPRKQYIVMLEGQVEIQVSDGQKRTFGPGEIVLVEDTVGEGHKSKSPDGKPRKSIFLPVPTT